VTFQEKKVNKFYHCFIQLLGICIMTGGYVIVK